MGIAFTIDSPFKVAHYGIDSVVSIGDDMLIEKLRKKYCEDHNFPYEEIDLNAEDHRAKRLTAYLNLMNELVNRNFENLVNEVDQEFKPELNKYFDILPPKSTLKSEYDALVSKNTSSEDLKNWLRENLTIGKIDVNIMTKIDKENVKKDVKLPVMYNDAHAGIRGFAQSDLDSSVILSAGMNPRLFGYMENFEDFYPTPDRKIKKKIVLKVSDYRSALIQGKFFAKKGLWVSEYRIESGLNCGGHAFATDGFLMGPILEEFRNNRNELAQAIHELAAPALENKGKFVPDTPLDIKITCQGGVGTAEEQDFLIDHYKVDSVGWGTPMLLVEEVTTLDDETRNLLVEAKEKDLYLSASSPLGVPFNNLRTNTQNIIEQERIEKNRPGSPCPKKYLVSNKEFTDHAICTASRQYQHAKLQALEKELSPQGFDVKKDSVTVKSCICVGLGTAALVKYGIEHKKEGPGVSICPGPNMAYFSKLMNLKEITDHIYGRDNVISRDDRPNMFVKELDLYLKYLTDKISETAESFNSRQKANLVAFANNLEEGIEYNKQLFTDVKNKFEDSKTQILSDLNDGMDSLKDLMTTIEMLNTSKVA